MKHVDLLIQRYPQLCGCRDALVQAVKAIVAMHRNGGLLLLCGNGGSAADCEHISGELLKGFLFRRPLSEETGKNLPTELAQGLQGGVRAVPLTSLFSLFTAFSNDVSAELAFAQGVWAFGDAKSVFLGISTSGNAANVCAAAKAAKAKGMETIALTGASGGSLGEICNLLLAVPEIETFRVQELHLPLYHALCAQVEEEIFGGTLCEKP